MRENLVGQRVVRFRLNGGRGPVGRERFRHAPVHDLNLGERTDHHVGGLEVAVDDIVGMSVADRLTYLLEVREELPAVLRGSGALLQEIFEGVAVDELHRQERPAVGKRPDLVNGRNARVLKLPGDPGFVVEAAGGDAVGGIARVQDLEGDMAIESDLAGAVDESHSARTDFLKQFVPRRCDRRRGVELGIGIADGRCEWVGCCLEPGCRRGAGKRNPRCRLVGHRAILPGWPDGTKPRRVK